MENVKKYLLPALVVLVVAVSAVAFYFYKKSLDLERNPQKVTQNEIKKLVAQVSRLMILPENETPTLATVADPAKLKDQIFFAKATKGDKVLIYTNAKKAILYNPETNKIVEVAPINIGPLATPAPIPKPTP